MLAMEKRFFPVETGVYTTARPCPNSSTHEQRAEIPALVLSLSAKGEIFPIRSQQLLLLHSLHELLPVLTDGEMTSLFGYR